MNEQPRASVTRFVRAIASAELARADAAPSGASRRIFVQLHDALWKLIGRDGFNVLVARSIVLARRTRPHLAGVAVGPGGTLTGLDDAAPRSGSARVELDEDVLAVVAQLLELLCLLIGEDLAMRLVRDAWPGAFGKDET
jgi:hypothetical protein